MRLSKNRIASPDRRRPCGTISRTRDIFPGTTPISPKLGDQAGTREGTVDCDRVVWPGASLLRGTDARRPSLQGDARHGDPFGASADHYEVRDRLGIRAYLRCNRANAIA